MQPERDVTLPGLGDRYELAGVVYRRGRTAGAARFHCVLQCDDRRWWRFEDGCLPRVFRGDLERSELRSVHLMVYTRPRGKPLFAEMGPLVSSRVAVPTGPATARPEAAACGQEVEASASRVRLGGSTLLKRRRAVAPRAGIRKGVKRAFVRSLHGQPVGQLSIARYLLGRRL